MIVEDWNIDDVTPYDNNPRINEGAVDYVANSIEQFGFQQPIVVDSNGVIIVGHTRYKAGQRLGLETVPVLVARNLTSEQAKAYRLADNKTGEFAEWDFGKLEIEFEDCDFGGFEDFGFATDDFFNEPKKTIDNTSREIPLEDYADERFEHECPRCGFRFNRG